MHQIFEVVRIEHSDGNANTVTYFVGKSCTSNLRHTSENRRGGPAFEAIPLGPIGSTSEATS